MCAQQIATALNVLTKDEKKLADTASSLTLAFVFVGAMIEKGFFQRRRALARPGARARSPHDWLIRFVRASGGNADAVLMLLVKPLADLVAALHAQNELPTEFLGSELVGFVAPVFADSIVRSKAMQQLELGYVSVLMRSALETRRQLQSNDSAKALRDMTTELRWNARALHHAANLLDEEELLVICPAAKWGARVKLVGVTCNFQVWSSSSSFLFM